MQQVVYIFRKEFGSYFISPVAYIVISIFLLVTGWFFFTTFFLLDQANLFVIPLDDERKWFRYHHLFQALLKRQLKQRLKAEEIVKLYKLASAWFAENGYIEEALSHALESGDKQAAALPRA